MTDAAIDAILFNLPLFVLVCICSSGGSNSSINNFNANVIPQTQVRTAMIKVLMEEDEVVLVILDWKST